MAINSNIVDRFGKPVGYDQTSPYSKSTGYDTGFSAGFSGFTGGINNPTQPRLKPTVPTPSSSLRTPDIEGETGPADPRGPTREQPPEPNAPVAPLPNDLADPAFRAWWTSQIGPGGQANSWMPDDEPQSWADPIERQRWIDFMRSQLSVWQASLPPNLIAGFEDAINDPGFQTWYPEVGTWEPDRWRADPNLQGQVLNHYEIYSNQTRGTPNVWEEPAQGPVLNILNLYPHTPAGLQAALPELQRVFGPHVTITGSKGDKLDFGNGLVVDVIRSAGQGGLGWQWLIPGAGGKDSGGGGTFTDFLGGSPDVTPVNIPQSPIRSAPSSFTAGQVPASTTGKFNPFTFTQDSLPTFKPTTFGGTLPTLAGQTFDPSPLTIFTPGELERFLAPDNRGLQDKSLDRVSGLIDTPVLGPQVISQIKEQQKEDILSLGEQIAQQVQQRGASRNVSQGGAIQRTLADLSTEQAGDITRSFRDVDIAAADRNRASILEALVLSEQLIGGQFGRGLSGFQTNLSRDISQEQLKQAGIKSVNDARRFEREREVLIADEAARVLASQVDAQKFDREGAVLSADERHRAFESLVGQRKFAREGEILSADEAFRALGASQVADADLLKRFLSQQELNQAEAQDAVSRFQADEAARVAVRGRDLQEAGLDLQGRGLDLQQFLGQAGLSLDTTRLENEQNNAILRFLLGL